MLIFPTIGHLQNCHRKLSIYGTCTSPFTKSFACAMKEGPEGCAAGDGSSKDYTSSLASYSA